MRNETQQYVEPTNTRNMQYRRARIKGGRYFFTVVTYERKRILTEPDNVSLLKNSSSASRQMKKEQAVWQRRFWEHLIRDEQDFVKHVEYIHYNPVKHGLVKAPKDWEYSSFHRYVREGMYDLEWGAGRDMMFKETIGRE